MTVHSLPQKQEVADTQKSCVILTSMSFSRMQRISSSTGAVHSSVCDELDAVQWAQRASLSFLLLQKLLPAPVPFSLQ